MRSYSNFLLFEDFLDNIPSTSGVISYAGEFITKPQVPVVQADCGTFLGKRITLNFEAEGFIETTTGLPLTSSRISYLLSQGQYNVFIRSTSHCTSEGGICQKCFNSSYPDKVTPAIGTLTSLEPLYASYVDVVTTDGLNTTFSLTKNPADFVKVLVFNNGVITSSGFSFSGASIIFSSVLPVGQRFVVRFYEMKTSPLLGYFSRTYSGGLMGLAELPTQDLLIRPLLYETLISDNYIDTLLIELDKFSVVPDNYLSFISEIHTKLEKLLYILYLYIIYDAIEP